MAGRDRTGDRGDVDDVGRSAGLERRQEGPQAPDRAEIVRADELLDLLGLESEEAAPAAGNAGVVDEQADCRVPLANGCGDPLDFGAVRDVADLILGSHLARDLAQPLLAPREEHEPPATLRERAGDRGADPARAAGDDCHRARGT